MRKILLAFILLFIFSAQSFAAIVYSGTAQYVSATGNAAMTIPDSDWTIAGWVKFSSRTGSGTDYITAVYGAEAYYGIWVPQASAANANKLTFQIYEYADVDFNLIESGTSFASNTSATHVAARRSGTTFTIWVNGSQVGTSTNANVETVTIGGGGTLYFGIDADASTGPFHGNMWDWAKWDRALSSDEIATLAKGFSANCIPNSQKWFYPMGGPYGYYKEMLVPITVTNSSTTTSDAQRIIYCN